MFRNFHLVWADKLAFLIAVLIVCAALVIWVSGIVGLGDYPHLRFDNAMLDWTAKAELLVVPAIWLLLRTIDYAARGLVQVLRSSLGRADAGDLRLPSYSGVEAQA